MTAAYEAWLAVYIFAAAVVAVMCLIAGAHHLWVSRLVGPVGDDPQTEYADKADEAIFAATDWSLWEQEVSR